MIARRTFLRTASAAAFTPRAAFSASAQSSRLYVGTGLNGPGNGIFSASWNAATGEIGPLTLAAEIDKPTFLAQFRRPDGQLFLYALSELNGAGARLSAFTAVAGQPALKLLNHVASGGDSPAHVSLSPDGRTVLVSNYGGGSVTSFLVLPEGSLSPAVSHFQYTGSGPTKGRQDAPHAHSAVTSPDGRFVLVNDLGLDRIVVYRLDSTTAELTAANPPFWSGRPGSGPRHLAWSPDGRFVYCANELDSTVDILAWDESSATLHSAGFVSSLPAGFPPRTASLGEIVASTDGRNVYAGNRIADDTIAVFDVDRHTHLLSLAQSAPGGGKNARFLALDPTQRWMLICHQDSYDLVVLERDRKTGRLSDPIHTYPAQKPMCVLFA